ncbi:MAG: GtrA family protein [Tannerellaceae bacterium]|jgi:putative flippase GtrA|nr:GtrA family protein [Tannerellaceae bacterium]
METIKQVIKYGIVGAANTLITAAIIWVMMKKANVPAIPSNIVGYAFGVLNSFIWNKQWTFKSSARWIGSAMRFGVVFGICYLLQLMLLICLNRYLSIDPYYNQLIAMAFYTVVNFLMNKYFTFKA